MACVRTSRTIDIGLESGAIISPDLLDDLRTTVPDPASVVLYAPFSFLGEITAVTGSTFYFKLNCLEFGITVLMPAHVVLTAPVTSLDFILAPVNSALTWFFLFLGSFRRQGQSGFLEWANPASIVHRAHVTSNDRLLAILP